MRLAWNLHKFYTHVNYILLRRPGFEIISMVISSPADFRMVVSYRGMNALSTG